VTPDQQRAREAEILRENEQARQRAASPATRDQIDPSTGRTWADAVGRGMYGEGRLQTFREMIELHQRMGREYQQSRCRTQAARGWN